MAESAWHRANKDTEKFRRNSKWYFWLVEIVGGGAVFGIIGGLIGWNLMPPNASTYQQNAYPLIGAGIGVVIGFALAFVLIFTFNLVRAPYLQRNEARTEVGNLVLQKDKLNTLLEIIVPKLQVTPFDILDSNIAYATMVISVLNYSDYIAKNVSVDIKFGDSLWKHDLWKAASINGNNQMLANKDDPLIAEILAQTTKQRLNEMLKYYLDHPILDELKPGGKIQLSIIDMNRDWISKQQMFFGSSVKSTPINPNESMFYQESQGWKEQIENTKSGDPIKILLHTVWENEINKKFIQIVEYQLICITIGTGKSYKFLPTGNVIGDQ